MHYQYRHTLDAEHTYPDLSVADRAVLDAAFEVAGFAHTESRHKIDPHWQYICHPIMVCDILYRMGERDPMILAAGLLHDTIEDCPEFKRRPERLQQRFRRAMDSRGFDPHRAFVLAGGIGRLVWQVTNPKIKESKEVTQVERAKQMSFQAKKIKIADQAASLICNLTMANDPEIMDYEFEQKFTHKALGLVRAILLHSTPEEREQLKPWEHFFGRTAYMVTGLLQQEDKESHAVIRQAFDFDRLFTSSREFALVPQYAKIIKTLPAKEYEPRPAREVVPGTGFMSQPETPLPKHFGIGPVHFAARGKVGGFELRVAHNEGRTHAANKLQAGLAEAFRQKLRWSNEHWNQQALPDQIDAGERTLIHEADETISAGRMYHFQPPVRADIFTAICRENRACWLDQVDEIAAVSEALKAPSETNKETEAFEPATPAARERYPYAMDGPKEPVGPWTSNTGNDGQRPDRPARG